MTRLLRFVRRLLRRKPRRGKYWKRNSNWVFEEFKDDTIDSNRQYK